MQRLYLVVLLLLGAVWGASFLFIKIGVAEMAPETLVAVRLIVSALILQGVLRARGLRLPRQRRAWVDLFVLAITGLIIPYLLITWGEQYMASGMAAILNATTPLFAVLLSYVWTHEEQLSGAKLLGVAIGFVGVVVAVGLADLGASGAQAPALGASAWPQVGVLVAALSYAIAGIYGRRAFRGVPALVPAAGQLLVGAIIITPIALVLRGVPDPLPSARALEAVLALSILGTALAYVLFYWLMERIGASRTSMVTYLLPPFALVYGAAFLSEPITLAALLGLGLVVVGILLANGVIKLPTRRQAVVVGTSDKV